MRTQIVTERRLKGLFLFVNAIEKDNIDQEGTKDHF